METWRKDFSADKTNNGNCSCVRVVWSIDRRLIFMSTNLEYRERERQTRGRRQASEAQREKEQQRASARDKKQRRRISLEKQHENFVAVVRKWEMLPVSKVKMCFCSKKKKANRKTSIKIFCEHIRHFLHKTCNYWGSFTLQQQQRQGNVQKRALHVQVASCFFAEYSVYKISEEIFYPNL